MTAKEVPIAVLGADAQMAPRTRTYWVDRVRAGVDFPASADRHRDHVVPRRQHRHTRLADQVLAMNRAESARHLNRRPQK